MNAIATLLNHPDLVRLSLVLLHFVWQGAALGLVALALIGALRRTSPAARYMVLLAILVAMAVAPAATFLSLPRAAGPEAAPLSAAPLRPRVAAIKVGPQQATAVVPSTAQGLGTAPQKPARPVRGERLRYARIWLETRVGWVGVAWFLGVLILSLRLLMGWVGLVCARRRGDQPADDRWQAALSALMARLRVTQPVRLLKSAATQVPAVMGWLRPVILLPASALTGLTPEQIEALIAHELAHVRRHDYLANAFQAVVETLLFYHPAVWWVSSRIRVEREHCCDDLTVACCGDALTYAHALTEMERLRGVAPQPVLMARGGPLLARVRRLLGQASPPSSRSTSWLAGALAVAVVVALGVALSGSVAITGGCRRTPAVQAPAKSAARDVAKAQAILDEALRTARSLTDKRKRDAALRALVMTISQVDKAKALRVARSIEEPRFRADALSHVAESLARSDRLRAREVFAEAVGAAQRIEDERSRDWALRDLVLRIAQADPKKALEVARMIKSEAARADTLSSVAAAIAETDRARSAAALNEALELARSIKSEWDRGFTLARVAALVASTDPRRAIEIARRIEAKVFRTLAVRSVLESVAKSDLGRALALARTVEEQSLRDAALQRIAVNLAEKEPEKALKVARTIKQKFDTAYALAAVSRVLARTDPGRSRRLALEALDAARQVAGPRARAIALRMVALALSRSDVQKALEVAQSIEVEAAFGNTYWQMGAFQSIALTLAKTDPDKALEAALRVKDRSARVRVLLALACAVRKADPSRSAQIIQRAREVAETFKEEPQRRWALSEVVRASVEMGAARPAVVRKAVRDIGSIRDKKEREDARESLVFALATTNPDKALEVARGIEGDFTRAAALTGLAYQILDAQRKRTRQ